MDLILASGSPRRKELLSLYTTNFTICVSDFDESTVTADTPARLVEKLARGKCLAVAENHPGAVVLGCDTVVDVGGEVFGKPRSTEDAKRMLRALSGATHEVHTGVCVSDGLRTESFVDSCKVTFFPIPEEEIRTDGSCTLYNAESRERFTCRHLHEINMDWLVTVWERYLELCVEQDIWKGNAVAFLKDRTGKPEEEIISFVETSWDKCQAYTDNLKAFLGEDKDREIWIFSFPLDEFERDVPAGKIIVDYENNPATRVEKMTPLEFTANINDECFDDRNNWVRAIELPKQE